LGLTAILFTFWLFSNNNWCYQYFHFDDEGSKRRIFHKLMMYLCFRETKVITKNNKTPASKCLFFKFVKIQTLYNNKTFLQRAFFQDAVDMFDDLFIDENFVPSDVLAALVLIYSQEESRRERMKLTVQHGSPLED